MKVKMFIFFSVWLWVSCSNQKPEQVQEETAIAATAAYNQIDVTAIALVDLQGNPVQWKDLQGKTVFLNFWATWCKPCIMEMPSMDKAYEALKDKDFVFLAASYEEPEKIKSFQEKQDFSFPLVHMKTSLEELNIYSIPTTFIINKEGKLVETIVGSRQWDAPETLNKLKQL